MTSIETRIATMTAHSPASHLLRAETGPVRAWRLVTSFFAIAARSLPTAGA